LKHLKVAVLALALFSTIAGAAGLPASNAPDFSIWARNTLKKEGVADGRVVETRYPFSFTYCRKDSGSLWRYDAMSTDEINAVHEGRIVKSGAQKMNVVETDSALCRIAS
jgi:hypothetical protein